MKTIVVLFLILSFGQRVNSQAGGLGINYNPLLTQQESDSLNTFFSNQGFECDFSGKKVAFVSLDLEIRLISKPSFFEQWVRLLNDTSYTRFMFLDDEQRIKTGGMDATIIIQAKNKEVSKRRELKILKKIAECEANKPENLYELGLDNERTMSDAEADFFNVYFSHLRKNFDFTNKNVAFFYGNLGSNPWSKIDYFKSYKQHVSEGMHGTNDYLLLLSKEQKQETGGCDAIIVSWSKLITVGASEKMIQTLKEGNKQ